MIKTETYSLQQSQLPGNGKHIIANFDSDSITVYQAFKKSTANYAVSHQTFGGKTYSFKRMTWIKPGFMWMMYRSGWAKKNYQERILAIRMSMAGFRKILNHAVLSTFNPDIHESHEIWENTLERSEVRVQWDPDHGPHGGKLDRKAIQIGIKGKMLQDFNDHWIIKIEDLTEFVQHQHLHLSDNFDQLMVPYERVVSADHLSINNDQLGIDI